jgi:diaminopimelate decarboxylase/aspartate kinase
MRQRDSLYVYHAESVRAAARALRALPALDRVLYAMKANPLPQLLQLMADEGVGFECVSRGEIEHLVRSVPSLPLGQILFTPNFAPRAEYQWALQQGVQLTVDNLYVLREWGDLLRGREIFVRVDTGTGRGHHHHVRTAGTLAKFGIPLDDMDQAISMAREQDIRITGLHAHTGSGVFDVGNWSENATLLLKVAEQLPHLRTLNVGGGLGVPESHEQRPLDLQRLNAALAATRTAGSAVSFWLEPGRYLVAGAGVLLVRVTQIKRKDDTCYIGVATGMNSLIRPALYGAFHEIVNLTRLEDSATESVNIVGPICESADFLGHDRLLPLTQEGDVLLIANAGAYGHSMSSHYNLREPAGELLL